MQIFNVSAQMFLEKIHSMGEEHFEKNITQSVFFELIEKPCVTIVISGKKGKQSSHNLKTTFWVQ